jgi:hypothetical protein
MGNFKHGLTGRIFFFNEAEKSAYDNVYRGLKEALAPADALEDQIVKSLVDDQRRMDRAACLESSIFGEGAEKFAASSDASGDPEIDLALSAGRVWQEQAKNLNLLSLYTSRFHRRYEKNMAELRRLQAARKASIEQAIEEAALLSHMAKSKGETYNMAEAFTRRNFEFSTEQIGRMVTRWRRLLEAKQLAAATHKPFAGPRSGYDGPPACDTSMLYPDRRAKRAGFWAASKRLPPPGDELLHGIVRAETASVKRFMLGLPGGRRRCHSQN